MITYKIQYDGLSECYVLSFFDAIKLSKALLLQFPQRPVWITIDPQEHPKRSNCLMVILDKSGNLKFNLEDNSRDDFVAFFEIFSELSLADRSPTVENLHDF